VIGATPHTARRAHRAESAAAERLVLARWRRLGLRGRVMLALAVIVLVLSVIVAATVFATVSGYLLSKRTQAAVTQAMANAERLNRGLMSPGVSTAELLTQLEGGSGSTSMMFIDGRWLTTSLDTDSGSVPAELKAAVVAGKAMHQRINTGRGPELVVGIPLAGVADAYFEVFPLTELDQTLRTLSTALVLSTVTFLVASLLLGWWALRPAFRPLDRVATAAAAVAAGDLNARLDARGDPGLMAIATSFNDTAARLQRRVQADAKFAADVSHELRSPLTTMLSAVDLFEGHRSSLPPDGKEALDLMRAEVQRFERLVGDLLEISRADAGSADVVLEPVVLAEVVKQSVPPRLQDRLVMTASAKVTVCVDKLRLERVLMNLIDNAQQHGGGLTAVIVSSHDTWGTVSVEDSGSGIDHDERERIFDRFARGRRSARDSADGAGLGLSLVARHVALMSGAVAVEDVQGGGTRFIISLPKPQDSPCED
jgi:two-component system, OmpR family, sensor histidine kinase MtrB